MDGREAKGLERGGGQSPTSSFGPLASRLFAYRHWDNKATRRSFASTGWDRSALAVLVWAIFPVLG